jgi:hypothetical protein
MIGTLMRRLFFASLLFASLFAMGAAPAFAQDSGSAADIAFWNSVKDSKSAAEVQAYIDKFPNGTFAGLAKLRLKSLQGTAGQQPKAAPVAATPPGSSDVLRMVQVKLYNLNYEVAVRDGRMNAETRDAVSAWRRVTKSSVTGDLTPQEIAVLNEVVPPKTWGAIGYNSKGGASTHWNIDERQKGEALALAGCKKLNGGACNVVTAANAGCGAVSHAAGVVASTRYNSAFAIVRATLGQATDVALTECRAKAKVPNACAIRVTMCADGSHKK